MSRFLVFLVAVAAAGCDLAAPAGTVLVPGLYTATEAGPRGAVVTVVLDVKATSGTRVAIGPASHVTVRGAGGSTTTPLTGEGQAIPSGVRLDLQLLDGVPTASPVHLVGTADAGTLRLADPEGNLLTLYSR